MNEEKVILQEEICNCWLQYEPLWRKWAYKMASVAYEKEDWEQQSYIICIKAMTSYKEESGITFGAYYRMLLYREGKKCMNRQQTPLAYESHLEEQQVDTSKSVEQRVLDNEVSESVYRLLARCDETECFIVIAYYIQKQTLQEIAKALGMKYKAVENKKAKIMRKLKRWAMA